jgi:transaldolase
MNNRIEKLNQIGQSLWYDNIERKLLDDGTLEKMVQGGEIRGITSNPSIFNKAITKSNSYDEQIKQLTQKGLSKQQIFETLSVGDIQQAADLFAPLYEQTSGGDGYVSLEVSPYLANQTQETIAEAKKLWKLVDRPNLMVKIPGTLEGLPAITECIAAGLNINVTLIFGLKRYQQVIDAYLAGLEKRSTAGLALDRVASVASFFISRIDSKVDKMLELDLEGKSADHKEKVESLVGKAGLASGKLAYQIFLDNFDRQGARFKKLQDLGARPQRALWASTSTKNPAYPDTMYVDELVAPLTVNTVPPHTLEAFFDHGKADLSIEVGLADYQQAYGDLAGVGVDIEEVTKELELEGVKAFADAYTSLLESLQERMVEFAQ